MSGVPTRPERHLVAWHCVRMPQIRTFRGAWAVLCALSCLLVVGGCSPADRANPAGTTPQTTITRTRPADQPTTATTGAGPTTTVDASCPYLDTASAASDVGVRMGRVAVLSTGGSPIGCRFYADQDPAYQASEHLPGPNQPVLQIVSSRYADPTAAHNALARLAAAGANAYRSDLSAAMEGVSYQTVFDPADGKQDWAYVYRKATTVIVVTTIQRDTAFNAHAVAMAIADRF